MNNFYRWKLKEITPSFVQLSTEDQEIKIPIEKFQNLLFSSRPRLKNMKSSPIFFLEGILMGEHVRITENYDVIGIGDFLISESGSVNSKSPSASDPEVGVDIEGRLWLILPFFQVRYIEFSQGTFSAMTKGYRSFFIEIDPEWVATGELRIKGDPSLVRVKILGSLNKDSVITLMNSKIFMQKVEREALRYLFSFSSSASKIDFTYGTEGFKNARLYSGPYRADHKAMAIYRMANGYGVDNRGHIYHATVSLSDSIPHASIYRFDENRINAYISGEIASGQIHGEKILEDTVEAADAFIKDNRITSYPVIKIVKGGR